ncbi:unnamed protein product [Sphagnum balticum]
MKLWQQAKTFHCYVVVLTLVLERQLELRVSFFSVAMAGSDCSADPATLRAEQEAREEVALQSESEDYFDLYGLWQKSSSKRES